MICPNCNTEIPKDHLYCEKCGTEIQIVPIFEPELEESIHETLSSVADVIVEESEPAKEEIQAPKVTRKKRPKLKLMAFSFLGLFMMCLITLIFVKVNQYCSYDYQYQRAEECFMERQYDEATDFVKRAIEIDHSNIEAQMLLSELYIKYEKYDEALAVLLKLLEDHQDHPELYQMIVSIYVNQEDYSAINQLVKNCENVEIASMFQEYISEPPGFSLEEGTYDEIQALKLLSDQNGTIYYTLDGSEPSENSLLYVEPVMLAEGINVVKAIFVNQNGLKSEVASHTFQITVDIPNPPVIIPESKSYTSPEAITVQTEEVEPGSKIYYTVDGSDPDEKAIEYISPIPMPLGSSHYKFIIINHEGHKSEITEADYQLNISSLIDTATAENAVIMTLLGKGELLDMDGTYKDGTTHYKYVCNAAAKAGTRIYYLVEELKQEGDQLISNEHYYGVDVRTGELYNVTVNAQTGAFEFSLFSLLF